MRFLFDENISPHIVKTLRVLADAPWTAFPKAGRGNQYEIDSVVEEFEKGAADEDWIPAAGSWTPKPIVFSGDIRRVSNSVQRKIVSDSGMAWFVLSKGWTRENFESQIAKVIKVWPRVLHVASKTNRLRLYEITQRLKVVEM